MSGILSLSKQNCDSGSVNMCSTGAWEPINFEQWVPVPINFGKTALNSIVFFVQSKLEIGVGSFGLSISI